MPGSSTAVEGFGVAVLIALALLVALLWRRRRRGSPEPLTHGTHSTPARMSSIGRYRVRHELGRGATGIVYLADDPTRNAPVAIKTLALTYASADREEAADARARFFREAATAQRIRHPDVVAVLDVGEAEGLAYLVMEFAPGRDLLAHTRAGSLLPVETVLQTGARIALVLDHAHRLGIVHRDIKPANVLLDVESGVVKVTDFGVARLVDAERTRTGTLLGTPFYMSPEQLAGARVDGRSDLYSLGVVLHQLLTGSLPYRDGSPAERLRQIADEVPPDIRTLRPELPEAIAGIIALALQKRPGLRYATGAEFAEDLRESARRMADERTDADRRPESS